MKEISGLQTGPIFGVHVKEIGPVSKTGPILI